MKKTISFVCLTMLATAANSSNWLGFGASGKSLYLADTSSLVFDRTAKSFKVWVKEDASSNPSRKYNYALQHWEVLCTTHQMRVLSTANYDSAGVLLASHDSQESSFQDIIPDTIGQALEEATCPSIK